MLLQNPYSDRSEGLLDTGLGIIDISPMVVILAIIFVKYFLIRFFNRACL